MTDWAKLEWAGKAWTVIGFVIMTLVLLIVGGVLLGVGWRAVRWAWGL